MYAFIFICTNHIEGDVTIFAIGLYTFHFRSKITWDFALFESVQNRLPNIPVLGWLSMKEKMNIESSCSIYPGILDIEYRNTYWQIFHSYDENKDLVGTYHLYSAYIGVIYIVCAETFFFNFELT